MFKNELKEKYEFLTQYFESGIKSDSKALAHSILLYGNDIKAQYDLAQEIARLLNCKESKSETCNCINCTWAKDLKHPAIMTISKIDSKPTDDDSKTVISVKQSQMIKASLMNTSDYHRVFIFCDAEIIDGVWAPSGLNQTNFQEETANSLLKIIEEPPNDTTFFFLTRDKEDLISTIISRSQSFFVPSFSSASLTFEHVKDYLSDYPNIERKSVFDFSQMLFDLTKTVGAEKVLDGMQNYLLAMAKGNIDNFSLKDKIIEDIKTVEKAKKQIKARVLPQVAIENMCLELTKN